MYRSSLLLITFLLLTACTAAPVESGIMPPVEPPPETITRSRHDFAAALAQIKELTTSTQVLALLGKPDDIITDEDPPGIDDAGVSELWCYGTDHHLGFPTLATLAMSHSRFVQYKSGTTGADDLVAALGEPKLRHLLRLLAQTHANRLNGEYFHPRHIIAAVNALQPLGKEISIAAIDEYLHVSPDRPYDQDGLIAVARTLFDVPPAPPGPFVPATQYSGDVVHPGYFRSPRIGAANWEPDDPTRFPRFPIVIAGGIPWLPAAPTPIGGRKEPALPHILEIEQHAPWRTDILHPSDDPLVAYANLNAALPANAREDLHVSRIIVQQFLRLVDTVYRPTLTDREQEEEYIQPEHVAAIMADATRTLRTFKIHWNPQANCYVRADGTILPPVIKPIYKRAVFNPHFTGDSGYSVTLTVQRESPRRIAVSLGIGISVGPSPTFKVRLIPVGMSNPPAEDSPTNSFTATGASARTYFFPIPAAQKIRIDLSTPTQHFQSPPLQP